MSADFQICISVPLNVTKLKGIVPIVSFSKIIIASLLPCAEWRTTIERQQELVPTE